MCAAQWACVARRCDLHGGLWLTVTCQWKAVEDSKRPVIGSGRQRKSSEGFKAAWGITVTERDRKAVGWAQCERGLGYRVGSRVGSRVGDSL